MNGVISWNPVVIGVIALIPAAFLRVIGVIAVVPAQNFAKDLLQKFEKFRVIGFIAVFPARNF